MGSKYSLLLILLLIFVQTPPTFQYMSYLPFFKVYDVNLSNCLYDNCAKPFISDCFNGNCTIPLINRPRLELGWWDYRYKLALDKEEVHNVIHFVTMDEIVKAVEDDGGFRIMSLVLKNQLYRIISLYESMYRWQKRISGAPSLAMSRSGRIVMRNLTITAFIPSDKSFLDYDRDKKMLLPFLVQEVHPKVLEYQFVDAKVDKEAFESGSIREGTKLVAANHHNLVVTGFGSINNVTITHWDVYNNGYIVVHGVEDFFSYSMDESTRDEL